MLLLTANVVMYAAAFAMRTKALQALPPENLSASHSMLQPLLRKRTLSSVSLWTGTQPACLEKISQLWLVKVDV